MEYFNLKNLSCLSSDSIDGYRVDIAHSNPSPIVRERVRIGCTIDILTTVIKSGVTLGKTRLNNILFTIYESSNGTKYRMVNEV